MTMSQMPSKLATLRNATIWMRTAPRRMLTTVTCDKEWESGHRKAPQSGAPMPTNLSVRQRQIIYRAKQRGWLELDILLGGWAVKHVPHMTNEGELVEIERLLDAETPDMLKWVLKHEQPPAHLETPVLSSIQSYALGGATARQRP